MASKVKVVKGREFVVGSTRKASKFPWAEWLDGSWWTLETADFGMDAGDVGKAIAKIKGAARKRFQVAEVAKAFREGDKLHKLPDGQFAVKARPMTDEEKAAEKVRRTERKKVAGRIREVRKDARKRVRDTGGDKAAQKAAAKQAVKEWREANK